MNDVIFYKVADSRGAVKLMSEQLGEIADGRILLLLSGGSAIAAEVAVLNNLRKMWPRLTITLIDERYGEPGHADSNWAQLKAAGLPGDIGKYEVLSGKPFNETVREFNNFLNAAVEKHEHLIGILGMGTDGHTSGLLPASPALTAKTLATGYEGPDYQRITTTPRFLAKLTKAYLYSLGESKWPQLERLGQELPVAAQPAQILKRTPELIVFNDLLGEAL